jgi:hypothetical protein
MNRRDQELLAKQLRGFTAAPRADGVMILAVLAVFFAGLALGGFLFGYSATPAPMRFAANEVPPALTFPHAPMQIGRD